MYSYNFLIAINFLYVELGSQLIPYSLAHWSGITAPWLAKAKVTAPWLTGVKVTALSLTGVEVTAP